MKLWSARVTVLVAALVFASSAAAQAPQRLSDQNFWTTINTLSEPARAFNQLEGLASNESMLQYLVSEVRRSRSSGVLIGVGPEQNYSYIAASRPKMAFIVDIRHEIRNLHLVYKALFELSKNRQEFLGRLFSRETPNGSSAREMLDAVAMFPSDSAKLEGTIAQVNYVLKTRHNFPLSDQDRVDVAVIMTAFYTQGPEINWWGDKFHAGVDFKSLNSTEMAGRGVSFLADDESFQTVKSLHARNLILPIIGDFGGTTALSAVSDYIRRHREVVSVFYGSNVDDFLKPDQLRTFCAHLADLPTGNQSIYIGGDGGKFAGAHPFPRVMRWCEQLAP